MNGSGGMSVDTGQMNIDISNGGVSIGDSQLGGDLGGQGVPGGQSADSMTTSDEIMSIQTALEQLMARPSLGDTGASSGGSMGNSNGSNQITSDGNPIQIGESGTFSSSTVSNEPSATVTGPGSESVDITGDGSQESPFNITNTQTNSPDAVFAHETNITGNPEIGSITMSDDQSSTGGGTNTSSFTPVTNIEG